MHNPTLVAFIFIGSQPREYIELVWELNLIFSDSLLRVMCLLRILLQTSRDERSIRSVFPRRRRRWRKRGSSKGPHHFWLVSLLPVNRRRRRLTGNTALNCSVARLRDPRKLRTQVAFAMMRIVSRRP